jgi:hypothetical protein
VQWHYEAAAAAAAEKFQLCPFTSRVIVAQPEWAAPLFTRAAGKKCPTCKRVVASALYRPDAVSFSPSAGEVLRRLGESEQCRCWFCAACGAPGAAKKCAACSPEAAAHYCNDRCQRSHRAEHKKDCAKQGRN